MKFRAPSGVKIGVQPVSLLLFLGLELGIEEEPLPQGHAQNVAVAVRSHGDRREQAGQDTDQGAPQSGRAAVLHLAPNPGHSPFL